MSTRSRKRREAAHRKAGGTLGGLRSGFKKAATVAAGVESPKAKPKRGALGTVVTIALVLAAAALLLYRSR